MFFKHNIYLYIQQCLERNHKSHFQNNYIYDINLDNFIFFILRNLLISYSLQNQETD
jgi:hypothetical protein